MSSTQSPLHLGFLTFIAGQQTQGRVRSDCLVPGCGPVALAVHVFPA